jgi:NCS1 family nucleobase:cation symporter-1
MYLLGVVFAPIIGIKIADYYLLRKQRLDVKGLYDDTPSGTYRFWGGFNLVAFVVTIVGMFVYWVLLDPVTYENRLVLGETPLFKYLTASIPSILISGALYWILSKAISIPARKGGYR